MFGESVMGELEWCPRATSTLKEAASASTIKEADPDIQEADSANKEAEAASTHQHFIKAANNIQTSPTYFLGGTGASHHIAHRLNYFSEIFPLPGIFKIHQVQGTLAVKWQETSEADKLPLHRQHEIQHPFIAKTQRSWLHPGV